jgi:hypothetical protein
MAEVPNILHRWVIQIDQARFDKMKTDERFWQLVTLSRAVNALRFVQVALLAHGPEDNSLQAHRTRYNSFFFNCALLYEALLLVERMGKHFRSVPEFAGLRDILKDPTATDIRDSNLNPLRNRLTFHFSENEIGAQLTHGDMVPRFASCKDNVNMNTYYELADLCTVWAFSGLQLDKPGALDDYAKQVADATNVAMRFMEAAEKFIAAVLKADGWEIKEDGQQSAPAPESTPS